MILYYKFLKVYNQYKWGKHVFHSIYHLNAMVTQIPFQYKSVHEQEHIKTLWCEMCIILINSQYKVQSAIESGRMDMNCSTVTREAQ